MRFTYPARLRSDPTGELIVSFRDLPECLTSGATEAEALAEAADALEEAIAGRIDDAERIPVPSARRSGEHLVAVPAATAAKAGDIHALRTGPSIEGGENAQSPPTHTRWHITSRPPPTSRSHGFSCRQRSTASGQRG